MWKRKNFNLTAILHRPKQQQGRVSQILQPKNDEEQPKDFVIKHLQQQNRSLLSQLQASKQQLQSMKQLLINTKIEYDNYRRNYEQILQQLKTQLSQKDELLTKCALTFRQSLKQNQKIDEIKQEQVKEYDKEEQYGEQNQQYIEKIQKNQPDQLKPQQALRQQQQNHQQTSSSIQLQMLRTQCQQLRKQLQSIRQKSHFNSSVTNDRLSFNSKPISKQSFDFGDITTQLEQVEEIAQFINNQQQINIRQERILNLQRQNLQLQHQIATKSHKLATIFNTAFQYGGMQLIDCLQNAIGLVESKLTVS